MTTPAQEIDHTRLGRHLRMVRDAISHLEWLNPVQRALVVENIACAIWYAEQDEQRRDQQHRARGYSSRDVEISIENDVAAAPSMDELADDIDRLIVDRLIRCVRRERR